jgi:hypothetical protein
MSSRVHLSGIALLGMITMLLISACGIAPSGETVDNELMLQDEFTSKIAGVDGVYISTTSSGLGNSAAVVRLYIPGLAKDTESVATIVDETFRLAWKKWPQQPVSIRVGVVSGSKPTTVQSIDNNSIDLRDVAISMGLPAKSAHGDIRLDAPTLAERYGSREAESNND